MPAKHDAFTPGLLSRLAEPPRKVVLLRASRIGDFLCATPAFRALRRALPRAEITLLTLPMLRDLAYRLPYIDRVEDFPGFPGIAEQLFDARRTLRFLQAMQEEQFDLAVQMQGSGAYSNPLMLMLGARATAGFVRSGDSPGRLDAALPYSEATHEMHTVLAMATFLGAPPQCEHADFPLCPVDLEMAAALLKGAVPPLIGIHPAARDAERRWQVERFAAVGKALRERYGGTVIVIGEKEEQATGDALARQIGQRCLNLVGKTPLTTLGAVISRLSVLVTNDTGPAHIAYALGTPTVTIFGAGCPRRYGPPKEGPFRALAFPCAYQPCGYTHCLTGYLRLEGITVSQVVRAVEEVMRSG
jgi:ADP-heptose:LPS heptosyltransferase